MVYGRYIYSFHAGDRQTFHWGAPSCRDWHFTNTYMFLQCQDVLIHVFIHILGALRVKIYQVPQVSTLHCKVFGDGNMAR